MFPQSTVLVFLVLSINPLHAQQKHLSSPARFSEKKKRFGQSKDKEIDLTSGNGIISSFTSSMLQQPQVLHVIEALKEGIK